MKKRLLPASLIALVLSAVLFGQQRGTQPQPAVDTPDSIRALVERLELEKYKATIKGLTQFGDRREGTDRNRAAVDWIEAQLESYGCTNTERIRYTYGNTQTQSAQSPQSQSAQGAAGGTQGADAGRGAAQGRGGGTGGGRGAAPQAAAGRNSVPVSAGGGRPRGIRARTGVNTNPALQPDEKLRALNTQPSTPGPREEVFCTKIGTTRPDEMYIVAAHMDGHGWGEAANDNGSGTAIVMELARVLNAPDVRTDRSVRFALWNNEETGLNGSSAYVSQRRELQGREDPPGSGRYPEPRWLGMIQHDMMLFDHGMPRADGTMSPEQRPEADVNVEFQINSKLAAQSQALAWVLQVANEKYATDYPASIGSHMTNTDSSSFMDWIPSISVRENERGTQIGNGWDPHWHQPTDVYATFSDKDFRLGLNAAQTTLSAIGQLVGAVLR